MQEDTINFYLNKQSVDIMEKFESINKKFDKILNELRKTEKIIEKEEEFKHIKVDERIRK